MGDRMDKCIRGIVTHKRQKDRYTGDVMDRETAEKVCNWSFDNKGAGSRGGSGERRRSTTRRRTTTTTRRRTTPARRAATAPKKKKTTATKRITRSMTKRTRSGASY
jgi:hypothetical protein